MNGTQYFMLKQGRCIGSLATLTGIPESVIQEIMDEGEPMKPSNFYIRLADALGVTVEELIKKYGEEHCEALPGDCEGGNGMNWERRFERKPDTCCKIYLAKITGLHAEYRYSRTFQPVQYSYSKGTIYCRIEGLEDGVYEVHARWYDANGIVVDRSRGWFAVVNEMPYELDERDVQYALNNLDAWKNSRSAAA